MTVSNAFAADNKMCRNCGEAHAGSCTSGTYMRAYAEIQIVRRKLERNVRREKATADRLRMGPRQRELLDYDDTFQ